MPTARRKSSRSTATRATKKPAPPAASTPSQQPAAGKPANGPIFAEPNFEPDPTKFKVPHASDSQAYAEMDALIKASKFLPLPFPAVNGVVEPVLTLATALGSSGPATLEKIQQNGQIVFQTAGDTGATRGPKTENQTVDKMLADFQDETPDAVPQFFYNLGDIVYSFGEHKYYYDQFYDAYRNYPRPIFAIPGNHDGIVLPPPAGTGSPSDSLSAFLANFCAPGFAHSADAVGISRTTMIQPGVYFTLEAPYVRILGIYSNMLENPGVISSTKDPKSGMPKFDNLSDVQLEYLQAALARIRSEKFAGAVILAVHHPPYGYGKHSGSMVMLKEIDGICADVGVWPHAVLSGHAHNYQRFTRTLNNRQIPFIVCGNGGHGLQSLSKTQTIRTPQDMKMFAQPERKDSVTFESYDDKNYGYLRVIVDPKQLRIEYHPASDGSTTKTPDDFATVDLASGTLIHYIPA
ncbi:MAG TPA: metallophosphoesterase [Candidatus Binatia bacterium]|nr:metallophosphoesterase [Candidatus Binatia bacterium]